MKYIQRLVMKISQNSECIHLPWIVVDSRKISYVFYHILCILRYTYIYVILLYTSEKPETENDMKDWGARLASTHKHAHMHI